MGLYSSGVIRLGVLGHITQQSVCLHLRRFDTKTIRSLSVEAITNRKAAV